MRQKIELRNQVFGSLTVLGEYGRDDVYITWLCQCVCGELVVARGANLRSGNTRSCGCFQKKMATMANTTHGMTNSPTYKSWESMIKRCYNDNENGWDNYGGRGIKVCRRWHKFENFLTDMGIRPILRSLDRKNNDKGYSPGNCKWSTRKEQSNNRRPRKHAA